MVRRLVLLASALIFTTAWPVAARASNCAGDSTGLVPLIDLKTGFYQGFQGGLYSGGTNTHPAAHEAQGLAIAESIVPLDTLGNPNASGRVVLISIGMSNATQEFSAFVPKSNADPLRHPQTIAIDCAEGGQATQDIRLSSAAYWDTVASRLRRRGSSLKQAQIVWLKEARRNPTEGFPAATDSLNADLGTIVHLIKQKLPNVRLLYMTSRIYAGYATSTLNPEPYAYESGFAVKWLIEAQTHGVDSLNFDPDRGPVVAPWLSWGPYLWADGLNPRSDGLTWACGDFVTSDGTHPSASGRDKVADSLLTFFHTDATAQPWYLLNPTGAVEPGRSAGIELSIRPNPFTSNVAFRFAPPIGERWRLEVLDVAGRRVREVGAGIGNGSAVQLRWDGRDPAGSNAAAGVYWARLVTRAGTVTRRILRLATIAR
jgi:hypothetical protein